MIKLVVTALFAAIIVVLLALSARAQQIVHRNNRVLPPIEFDRPYTGQLKLHIAMDIEEVKDQCNLPVARALACSFHRSPERCTIVILADENSTA